MKKSKSIIAILLAAIMMFGLVACGSADNGTTATSATESTQAVSTTKYEGETVRVTAIKGPTGIGMVQMMDKPKYDFNLISDTTEIASLVSTGAVDIAACPLNLAANLYKKTNGGIQMIAINTLGTLYLLTNNETVTKISDLAGKTVYASGQGSTPEYIIDYILSGNGLTVGKDVTVEYVNDHATLAAEIASGEVSIAILPEPFVSVAKSKNSELTNAISLTDEWNKLSPDTELSMGCVIATKDFIENHGDLVEEYIADYKNSVEFVNSNVDAAAALVADNGILASADIAKTAIPNCNIVFISGENMKTIANANFEVYFDADPTSIGGEMPTDALYYGIS